MDGLRNIATPADDAAARAALLADMSRLLGRDSAVVVDGRLHLSVPLEVYLAHVDTSTLTRAGSEIRRVAGIMLRAAARLDPGEFVRWCMQNGLQDIGEVDGFGARIGPDDLMQRALDNLPPETADEIAAVLARRRVAAEPQNKLSVDIDEERLVGAQAAFGHARDPP